MHSLTYIHPPIHPQTKRACLLACLELEAGVEEEVLGLDVAVEDAALVAVLVGLFCWWLVFEGG